MRPAKLTSRGVKLSLALGGGNWEVTGHGLPGLVPCQNNSSSPWILHQRLQGVGSLVQDLISSVHRMDALCLAAPGSVVNAAMTAMGPRPSGHTVNSRGETGCCLWSCSRWQWLPSPECTECKISRNPPNGCLPSTLEISLGFR